MELWTWSSGFGLSTWHPECLAMQTYAAFCGAPVSIRASDAPLWHTLPTFSHKGKGMHTLESLISYLSEQSNFDLDHQLSPRERSEARAFRTLLRDQIAPYAAFVLLVNEKNFDTALRPWMSSKVTFPLGMVFPGQLRRDARALCDAAVGSTVADEVEIAGGIAGEQLMESVLYTQASTAVEALAQKMGEHKFLLGQKPCSADALLYAYLAPMLKVTLPNNRIAALLQTHPNLSRFVDQVGSKYFPRLAPEKTEKEEEKKEGKAVAASKSNNFFAGLVALGAMAGYAYASGLYTAFRHVSIHMED